MKYIISNLHNSTWNGRYFAATRDPLTYSRKGTALNVARTVRQRMTKKFGPQSNMAHIIVRELNNDGNVVKTINV